MSICYVMLHVGASHAYTQSAVESFVRHTRLAPHDRWILIDNDGSWHGGAPAELEVVINTQPCSFAENANQARQWALHQHQSLCLLNNDLWFTPGWNLGFDATAGTIMIPNSNEYSSISIRGWCPVTGITLQEAEPYQPLLEQVDLWHHGDGVAWDQPLHMSFCAVYIPESVLEQVGEFDTGFVNGGEDVDYRLRAAEIGIRTCRLRHRFVLHFGGKSTWQVARDWQEIRQREQRITQRFRDRWGASATELFLRRHLQPDPQLITELAVPLLPEPDIDQLIRACRSRDQRAANVLYL